MSGKFEIYHLLTLSSPNFDALPPCDIRTHIINVNDEDFALELWVPVCDPENNKLRGIKLCSFYQQ